MVLLRDQRDGGDYRYLTARRNEAGDLLVEGEDWGRATSPVSLDGEYEWGWTVPADELPELLRVLDAEPDADVSTCLGTLQRRGLLRAGAAAARERAGLPLGLLSEGPSRRSGSHPCR